MNEAVSRFYQPLMGQGIEPARAMQCWYLATFLHWLLIDNDRCSMAFSLEGRFPFLNRRVFELALRIPASAQLGGELGEEKLALRHAFRDVLPESIWRHRKKAPLPSPMLLTFHARLRDGLSAAISKVPEDIWSIMDRGAAVSLLDQYATAIRRLELAGETGAGGEHLTRYLRLDEAWSVRTPQIFGLLTLLRWWTIQFS